MLTLDRGIKSQHLPHGLLATCKEFAHALATANTGPASAALLPFFRQDAFFMPHNKNEPQAGLGALRTYWRRHAGYFRGSVVAMSELAMLYENSAQARLVLQARDGTVMSGIMNLKSSSPISEDWLITHLWLQSSPTTRRPAQRRSSGLQAVA